MKDRLAIYYLARGFIEAEDSVLDIGCGNGYGTVILADRAFYALGVDKNVEIARGFEVEDFIEFSETVPRTKMECAVAFGEWETHDIQNIAKRLITNIEVNIKGWTEVYRFDCNPPIIIYDKE